MKPMANGYKSSVEKVIALLKMHGTSDYARECLSVEIAEKSVLLRHLYQDMGFKSRSDMNKMMKENFRSLALKKPDTVRWKKYLFDCIGEVAPACSYCKDMTNCFSCELVIPDELLEIAS